MDARERHERVIADREKRVAAVLGIEHGSFTRPDVLHNEVLAFLIDVLHLADHKRQTLNLEELAKQAAELYDKEKIDRPPTGGVQQNVRGWSS